MKEEKFYSICEIAERLDLSQKSVRRYIASGQLESVRCGSTYRIPEEALERFISSTKDTAKTVEYDLFGNIVEPDRKQSVNSPKTDMVNWCRIDHVWDNPSRSEMTFVDCFCGAGGLSKGLEMAGLEGICGTDWFKEAGLTYQRNFDHPFVLGDITIPEVKRHLYDVIERQLGGRHLNIVAGGFPCQGFSMAGNRIVDDPRNSLYKELLEVVRHLRPDFVICENVKGLRSMLGGMVEKKILSDFRAIGYDMNVTLLCAADYKVPQKRERVIFIGIKVRKNCVYVMSVRPAVSHAGIGIVISGIRNFCRRVFCDVCTPLIVCMALIHRTAVCCVENFEFAEGIIRREFYRFHNLLLLFSHSNIQICKCQAENIRHSENGTANDSSKSTTL